MVSAVTAVPQSTCVSRVVLAKAKTHNHKCIGSRTNNQSSQNACLCYAMSARTRAGVPGRASLARDDVGTRPNDQLFIGQIASETAACSGKIVTKFFAEYCNSTGSAKLFCPISSNLTRRHGMMV